MNNGLVGLPSTSLHHTIIHPCYIVHLLRSYQNDTLRHTNDDRYGLNDATNEDEDEEDAIRTFCTAASSFDIVLNMSFTHFGLFQAAA